jgi:hypothetical protein
MYKYVVLKSLPSGRVISRTNSAETLKKLNEFSKTNIKPHIKRDIKTLGSLKNYLIVYYDSSLMRSIL